VILILIKPLENKNFMAERAYHTCHKNNKSTKWENQVWQSQRRSFKTKVHSLQKDI